MEVSESVELLLVFLLVLFAEAVLYFIDRWIHREDEEG